MRRAVGITCAGILVLAVAIGAAVGVAAYILAVIHGNQGALACLPSVVLCALVFGAYWGLGT